jgi:hypothetical protein
MNIEAMLIETPGIGLELYCRRPGCKNAPYFVHEGLACCADCLPVISDFQRKVLQERKHVRDGSNVPAAASGLAPVPTVAVTIADMFDAIGRLSGTRQVPLFRHQLGLLAKFGGQIPRSTAIPLRSGETVSDWMHRPDAPAILKRMAGLADYTTKTNGSPDKHLGRG